MKIPSGVKRIEDFHDGWAVVELDDRQITFMNTEGNLQKGRYKDVGYYHEGFGVVQLEDDSWAFIDKAGKLQEGRYKRAWSYSKGFASVQLEDGSWTFVDREGKLQKGKYKEAWDYSGDFAIVKLQDGFLTFVDREGKLQEGRYKDVRPNSTAFEIAESKDCFFKFVGWEDKLQELIKQYTYGSHSEGFVVVRLREGSWTFIDREGKLQEGRYKNADNYFEGFARVQLQDDSWAFVDKEGNLQEGRYKKADNYSNGWATIETTDGFNCCVSKDGELDLSLQEWKIALQKDPTMFKLIPFYRFADEEFMAKINAVIKKVLVNYVKEAKDIESATIYVKDVIKLIREKTKAANEKIVQYTAEIEKLVAISKEEKVWKEELIKEIENFFDEKDE